MKGYDVVTNEDEKVGKVVGTRADHLIVESGTLRKTKHALPQTFARVDEADNVVRISVSKEMFDGSPKVNGDVDATAIADYYGLAGGSEAPPTEGYGETVADDPSIGSETQEERAEAREHLRDSTQPGVPEESPAMLGDRYRETREG
jgi:hypothetical protein